MVNPPQLRNPPPAIKKMLSCSVLYVCKSAERERERNCSYYDRFKSAEREKLQLLRPLHVCRERETAATTTASSLQRERNCSYYDRFKAAEREKLHLLYYDDRPPLNSQSPLPGASNQSRGGFINRKSTLLRYRRCEACVEGRRLPKPETPKLKT